MNKVLHVTSTLTERYQTTIPESVRRALHLAKHDRIEFTIENSGKVVLTRVEEDDPLIGHFLQFLADDIKAHPKHVSSIDLALVKRANALVKGLSLNLDEPLDDKDE